MIPTRRHSAKTSRGKPIRLGEPSRFVATEVSQFVLYFLFLFEEIALQSDRRYGVDRDECDKQIALRSDRWYRVDRDECEKHDGGGRWRYHIRRRRRREVVIIVVVRRGGRPWGRGRGRNDKYDNDKDNNQDGIYARRKVIDVIGVGKGLGTTKLD